MIANFEKIKKFNLNDPAWYNKESIKLQSENHDKEKSMSYLQNYLFQSKGNITELKEKLGIKITKHPNLPLMIFNYDHLFTPHDSLIGLECRGIVLEVDTWKIVAKPMYRFFNWGEVEILGAPHFNLDNTQFNFDDFVTQSKEDGSLMILYNYNDKWMLNTRSFFLNEVGKTKVIMSGIHEVYVDEVIKVFLSALNSKIECLEDLDKYLDKDYTYCFEFCSHLNRIVRNYKKSTVFLLAKIANKNFQEAENEETDKAAYSIGAARPKDYKLKTFKAIIEAMKEMINKDPSLEGFVIRDLNSSRWKIKSPSYFFLHHISYDRMRTPFPKDLVPLILQGEGTELFSILEINGFSAELYEVQKQWKFCDNRVKKGWEQIKEEWAHIINIKDLAEFEKVLIKNRTPFTKIIEKLYREDKKSLANLQQIWCEDPKMLVEILFNEDEKNPRNSRKAELTVAHISEYKKNVKHDIQISIEVLKHKDWWKNIEDTNNGLAREIPKFEDSFWIVHCHCGKKMKLFSVPEFWYHYKCCRAPTCIYCTSSIVDKNKAQSKLPEKGTHTILTYQCECGLSHRAHQHEKKIMTELKRRPLKGKPLGIPCSELCLAMRHRVHEEIDKIAEDFKWDKDTIYNEASKILDVNTEFAHVGMLGINECKKLIEAFLDMRGVE